jgi:hypothetical protein
MLAEDYYHGCLIDPPSKWPRVLDRRSVPSKGHTGCWRTLHDKICGKRHSPFALIRLYAYLTEWRMLLLRLEAVLSQKSFAYACESSQH